MEREEAIRSPDASQATLSTAWALDGAEIVWLDQGGVVHALDAVSLERTELMRLEGGEPLDAFDLWHRRVVVHHATKVLAVVTGRGTVRTAGLPGTPARRPAIELPVLELSGAALGLTADPIDADGAHAYEFGGTFTASGALRALTTDTTYRVRLARAGEHAP